MTQQFEITIQWTECSSYEKAKDFKSCVYIHEWDGSAYYVGLSNYWFGGNQRKLDGKKRSARYSTSYRHWIDGCLERGARLFVGKLRDPKCTAVEYVLEVKKYKWLPEKHDREEVIARSIALTNKEIEDKLIAQLVPPANRKDKRDHAGLILVHIGDVPEYLKQ